jgi:hypothetical protein
MVLGYDHPVLFLQLLLKRISFTFPVKVVPAIKVLRLYKFYGI